MKSALRITVSLLILLGLYHLIIFLIPFERETVFWISYGFALAAFLVGFLCVLLTNGKKSAKSRFYGFPIARLGLIYAVVQVLLSIPFMALGLILPWQVPVLLFSVLLAAALLGLISTTSAMDQIQEQDVKLKKDVLLMRALQSKVNQIASQCDVPAVKALAEELRYSDPVSSELLQEQEQEMAVLVSQMQDAAIDGDNDQVALLCRKTSAVLAERNRLCKLNKGAK